MEDGTRAASPLVGGHHHASGARHAPPPAARRQEGLRPDGQSRSGLGGTDRPGGEGGEALGRPRGGFTTEIHLSADGRCWVLSLVITPGQCADCTQFGAVMDRVCVPWPACGRPRTKAGQLKWRQGPQQPPNSPLPTRTRSPARHPGKGRPSCQPGPRRQFRGRPPGLDKDRYQKRNTVERAINKPKIFRAVATGFDKRGYAHLRTVTTAALVLWLRS